MATILNRPAEVAASRADDANLAVEGFKQLRRVLEASVSTTAELRIQPDGGPGIAVQIPASILGVLRDALGQMACGNAVAVVPVQAELTTQQAADLINVSRPFLVEQLEKGVIPYRMVGTHRRVLLKDLLEYKTTMDRKGYQALEELAAQAQELGTGY